MTDIATCLWFDGHAEDAVRFYTSIFRNSSVGAVTRYGSAGQEIHGKPPGSVLTIDFVLDGRPFTALNGGPAFKFNEAVSFMVRCESQDEIDSYWSRLGEGGDPDAQQCGWLKDRFGLSWQVVPAGLGEMLRDPAASARVLTALLTMKKLDLAALERAHQGV